MRLLVMNVLLALLWSFVWGNFSMYTFAAGFALGYLLLGIYSRTMSVEGYGTKAIELITFTAYFLFVLVKANLQIAYEVVTPTHHQKPRIFRYNVEGLSDIQITTLSNCITLTPGTLVIDISPDNRFLYIHSMYAEDRSKAVREIDALRDRMLEEVF